MICQQFPLCPACELTTFTGCRSFMRRHASCLLTYLRTSPGNLPAESQQTTESCQLTAKWPSWNAKAGIAVEVSIRPCRL